MPPLEPLCGRCFKAAGDLNLPALQRCGGCKAAFYCCQEHQKEDWSKHRVVCRRLQQHPGKGGIADSPLRCFNIVRIHPNVRRGNFSCGDTSPMDNVKFGDRTSALKYLREMGFQKLITQKETPFIQLMGFEVDLYGKLGNDADHEMNGACIYLTIALTDGLSPYVWHEPKGIFFAVPAEASTKVLTCDCLWGMRQVILEVLDDDYDVQIARQLCQKFKDCLWIPKDGNPRGFKFFGAHPEDCVSGDTETVGIFGDSARPIIPADKLNMFEKDASEWAQRHVSSMRELRDNDLDAQDEIQMESAVVADFIEEHFSKLPSEEAVRAYLEQAMPDSCSPYYHDQAQRLLQAGALPCEKEEERCQQIRKVGYELNYLGGMEAMRVAYYAVHHVLCSQDFLGVHIHSQGDWTILACWNSEIERLWDGIGDWCP